MSLHNVHQIIPTLEALFNEALIGGKRPPSVSSKSFGELCKVALEDQFRDKGDFYYRMSGLGKPLISLQCEKLGLEHDGWDPYAFMRFVNGHIQEALLITLMEMAGIEIQSYQEKLELEIGGCLVKGTLDLVIDDYVIDVKTASNFSFDKFKYGFKALEESDPFGYIMQMCLYAKAGGYKPGGWLVINKNNGRLHFTPFPTDYKKYLKKYLTNAEKRVNILENTHSITDIDQEIPAVPEFFRKKPTGEWTLCPDYTFFDYKKSLWGDRVEYREQQASSARIKPRKWYVND